MNTADVDFIYAGLEALADEGCRCIEYWGIQRPDDVSLQWYEEVSRDVEAAYASLGWDAPTPVIGPTDLRQISILKPKAYWGYKAVKALIQDSARRQPDGIFIADDTMATGVLVAFLELGIVVGQDIKIAAAAHRTFPVLFDLEQQITLLEYDNADIADALLRLLDQVVADPNLPETVVSVPFRVRVPDELNLGRIVPR